MHHDHALGSCQAKSLLIVGLCIIITRTRRSVTVKLHSSSAFIWTALREHPVQTLINEKNSPTSAIISHYEFIAKKLIIGSPVPSQNHRPIISVSHSVSAKQKDENSRDRKIYRKCASVGQSPNESDQHRIAGNCRALMLY